MGVTTSEVGYTSAMLKREEHEVHKDMWGQWKKIFKERALYLISHTVYRSCPKPKYLLCLQHCTFYKISKSDQLHVKLVALNAIPGWKPFCDIADI